MAYHSSLPPIDSLTLLHDHQEMTYHKTPDPASAAVPEINGLKSLIVTAEPLPPSLGHPLPSWI